jgi:hypothetical protein
VTGNRLRSTRAKAPEFWHDCPIINDGDCVEFEGALAEGQEQDQPAEIIVSRAWHDGRFGDRFVTTDGREVRIIHRGSWSHGSGPDFRDAMVEFDGQTFVTGSIEIHLQSNGWTQLHHHLDPAYNDVILHLVLRPDSRPTRRQDGGIVPIIKLDSSVLDAMGTAPLVDWSRFGGAVCAEKMTREDPDSVRAILWDLGDRRLAAKSARVEARLTGAPPSEVLYQELWEALGYSANRAPMRALAERLPLASLEAALAFVAPPARLRLAQALLFGLAGFIPFAPADQSMVNLSAMNAAEVERLWQEYGVPWQDLILPPTAWTRAGVRPANHPVRRLLAGSAFVATSAGLVSSMLEPFRSNLDPVEHLQHLSSIDGVTTLGHERAIGLIGNVIIPFVLALAEHTRDTDLSAAASGAWERLANAESNAITRRAQRQVAGPARLTGLGFRGQQGLIHLDQTLCSPRRCYECPIAARVIGDG